MRRPGCVAQPLALVARRELEELLERAGCRVDSGMAIAERREALWHRRQGKVRGIGGIHFVPPERRRDPRLGGGPHGVRRGDRAVLGVLIVVDEDAMALFLPPLARGELGDAALDG